MDFQLSEDQSALVAALQSILEDYADIPQSERHGHYRFDAQLQAQLESNGFLDAARDMGELEAALVVFESAQLVGVVDTLGRGLVAPVVCPDVDFTGPVALVERKALGRAIRNLTIASHLLVLDEDDVLVLDLAGRAIDPVESILAYPYGRFADMPDLALASRFEGRGPDMRRVWRIGLAAEIAGASRAAIDFTLDYVRNRKVFGRAVGSFQSVQHRLAMRHGHAKCGYYLSMRAAWSGTQTDAAIAACQAQSGISELMFDLHQFNGGMGMTNEHLLHFWLYRIRALQADVGGPTGAALDVAEARWGDQPACVTAMPETVL
ncbi:MAG: acyl-CoA dehydrogenase family protein [Novosphingobium sp.]